MWPDLLRVIVKRRYNDAHNGINLLISRRSSHSKVNGYKLKYIEEIIWLNLTVTFETFRSVHLRNPRAKSFWVGDVSVTRVQICLYSTYLLRVVGFGTIELMTAWLESLNLRLWLLKSVKVFSSNLWQLNIRQRSFYFCLRPSPVFTESSSTNKSSFAVCGQFCYLLPLLLLPSGNHFAGSFILSNSSHLSRLFILFLVVFLLPLSARLRFFPIPDAATS